MNLADRLPLMLILDVPLLAGRDPVAVAMQATRGGVTSVQLRWKGGGDRAVVALARQLRDALPVPVLVNDRLDIALAARCAGVHLGADDLPIPLARKIAPPGFIVGASVGDEKEAAASAGADYVGIGPWRATATKADAGAALGPAGVTRLLGMVKVPAVVIGGVRPDDVGAIAVLGASGIAVAGGILSGEDPEIAARMYST
ncbi:MAG TPA: thiamine phosphate synthase [Gemmatimonadales bacterium]|nr:thiamine phosphate synthase [Gemmatimonadales bacterium]